MDILEASGPNHPELGRFLNGLGRALLETGQLRQARDTYRRSLDFREKAFGKDHPETAGSLQSL